MAACLVFSGGCHPSEPPADDLTGMGQHLEAAQAALKTNDLIAAEREVVAGEKAAPGSPEPVLIRSKIFTRATRLAEQRDLLVTAHARWPHDTRITLQALYVDTMMARPVQTEKLARDAVADMPTSWESHYYLGMAILATEDKSRLGEASAEFHRAYELNPTENATIIELGRALSLQGDDVQAAAMLELASRNLDAVKGKGPVSLNYLERWIMQRRTAAFRLVDVYRRLGRKNEAEEQSRLASEGSDSASELRRLTGLGMLNPPDMDARARVEALCAKGVGFFTAARGIPPTNSASAARN